MKKYLRLLIIIAILFMPVVVKADMSAPNYYAAKIICNNKDGCLKYEYKWKEDKYVTSGDKVAYGTKVAAEFYYKGTDGRMYFDGSGSLWLESDFNKSQDVVDPSNFPHLKNKATAIVVAKEGATMYSGPNEAFSTVTTIPFGTKFEYDCGFDGDFGYGLIYLYTTYQGKSGWVYIGSSSDVIVVKEFEKSIKGITYEEIEYNGAKIPANTELEIKYGHSAGDTTYYVNYEGKDFAFSSVELALPADKEYTLNKDIEIKKDLKASESTKISKGTKVKVNYMTGTYKRAGSSDSETVYVYLNNSGWYKFEAVYDNKESAPFEEEYEFVFDNFDFVDNYKNYVSEETTTTTIATTTPESTMQFSTSASSISYEPSSFKLNPLTITIACLFVAILLGGLVAVIIIVIVVSKKNKKQEVVQQPVVEETTPVEQPTETNNEETK